MGKYWLDNGGNQHSIQLMKKTIACRNVSLCDVHVSIQSYLTLQYVYEGMHAHIQNYAPIVNGCPTDH